MLPPIDASVLQNNPQFAALHKILATQYLNPNGSTKNSPIQDERNSRAEALHTARLAATKRSVLITSLSKAPLLSLPAELRELVIILTLQLSNPNDLPPSILALLSSTETYASLSTSIPQISIALSEHLHKQALTLARLLFPSTNASFLHRQIPKIVPSIQALQSTLEERKSALEERRMALVPLTTRILSRNLEAIENIIRILEQTKHGQLARNSKAKAELLAGRAQQEALNSKMVKLKAQDIIYTAEVQEALAGYGAHLRDARARLRMRERDAIAELERYGVGREEGGDRPSKEKVFKEIARVYGVMVQDIEEVKVDIERLRRS